MAEKSKVKSPKKTAIAVMILLIILLLGFLLIPNSTKRWLYGRFYTGPHLRCEVILTANGQPVPIDPATVSGLPMANNEENTVQSCKQTDTGCKVSCKGGEYGSQPFQFKFQAAGMTEPLTVAVTPVVGDCWEISDVTVTIDADTTAKTIKWSSVMLNGKEEYDRSGELTFEEAAAGGIRFSNI